MPDKDGKAPSDDGKLEKSQKNLRGRRHGSTKGQKEMAEKLRSRGKSNEEIAKSLGVSARTVTRYLKFVREPASPMEAAVQHLPMDSLMKLFHVESEESPDEYLNIMPLFILKRLGHPGWKKFWAKSSNRQRVIAKAIGMEFDEFIEKCQMYIGSYAEEEFGEESASSE